MPDLFAHGACPQEIPGCNSHLHPATDAEVLAHPAVVRRLAAAEKLARANEEDAPRCRGMAPPFVCEDAPGTPPCAACRRVAALADYRKERPHG
jgi:hypothetical protein